MANNDGQIVLGLDKPKTVLQINADIKKLQNQLAKVKTTGALDTSSTVKQINSQISALQSQLKTINIKAKINTPDAQKTGQKIGQTVADSAQRTIDSNDINIDKLNADIKTLVNNLNSFSSENAGFDSFKTEINGVEISLDSLINKLSTVDNVTDFDTIRSQVAALKTAFTMLAQINEIQLSMSGQGKVDYNWQIDEEIKKLRNLGFTEEEAVQKVKVLTDAHTELKQVINSNEFDSIESKNKAIIESDRERTLALNQVKNAYKDLKTGADQYYNLNKQTKLSTDIQVWLSKNTRASKEAKESLNAYYRELSSERVSVDRLDYIRKELDTVDAAQRRIGRLGKTFVDQFKQGVDSFKACFSVTTVVKTVIEKTKNAISELKKVDTLLTEISKTNDKLSKSELAKIGSDSFDIASKYGKSATDFLSSVQEASRAGYENAMGIAELSVAAQGAGEMTAELANQMILATDKAYKLNGSVSELTKVLDGMNYITNHNDVTMTEISEAMSIVGSTAASFGVDVDKATAAVGTMIATTQQSGSEAARAFKAILLNIRQVSDEEEGIDAEGLAKYKDACEALNVKLTETKNGVLSLRDPMEVLRDLAIEYNKLDETDIRGTNLLSSLGDKLRSTQLDALLRQWDTYESMLQQYANGTGSMAAEAEKTANSWEGSLNRLSNTWTDTVGNIINSDAIITAINSFNSLLSVINSVTEALGSWITIGLGTRITAFVKNFA